MKSKHLILTLLALLTNITASAETWTDANGTEWYFEIHDNEATIISPNWGDATIYAAISGTIPNSITIPAIVYDGAAAYPVTTIGNQAFYNCVELTSVCIPESVKSIGYGTFENCSGLTSITIPNGVTSIGNYAFYGCTGLSSVSISNSVTSIGESAFSGCSSLTSITIPKSVISIVPGAFSGSNLSTIVVEEGNEKFDSRDDCNAIIETATNTLVLGIKSTIIPNSVTTIGSNAFGGCSDLVTITIPNNVTSIGYAAFFGCPAILYLKGTTPPIVDSYSFNRDNPLVVPSSAYEVYRSAEVWKQWALRICRDDIANSEVTIEAKESSSAVIEEIGEENALSVVNLKVSGTFNSYDLMVFRNKMINLRDLDLSEANVVGNSYCYTSGNYSKDNVITGSFIPANIIEFKMPKDITTIEPSAFYGCSNLMTLTIPEGVTALGNYSFSGCSRLKTITLPEGITSIPASCFDNCSALSEITIPESVTTIGDRAFYNCSNLTSIIIPDDVTSIGGEAFSRCSNLSYIYLPIHLQTISRGYYSEGAFSYCKIAELHLPPYLTSIGDHTFSGCSNLKDIYAYMPNIISIGTNTFNDYRNQNLYVPDFLYDQYYYDTNWSQFLSVNKTTLRPDDYKLLATNSDNRWKPEDQRTPDKTDGSHVDGEVNTEGSFTVEGETPQQFNELDQILDGEGKGGSLIGEGEDNQEGNLTANNLRVNIHVKPGRWYFFIFPYDVTIENVEYPGQYAWLYYDAAHRAQTGQTGWKVVEGETLQALHGYAFQTGKQGTMVVTFNNPRFFGDKLLDLVAHAADNIQHASWNLVGNPHSSFYEFLEDAFSAPITRWNPSTGTYTAYRPGDDDIHLQPYEAFFVQKPGNMDHIKFKDVCRESYRKSEEKKANHIAARRAKGINPRRRLINLEILSGEEQMDKTRVVLNNEKSHAYELDCDAAKMMSGDAKAQLYSVENGVQMAINERPQDGDIRLGYTAKAAGTLSISASRMDMPMMLVDTQLGTTFDLSLGSYDFDTAAGTFDGRFLLRPSGEATAINQLAAKTGVCIGTQEGGIAIGGAEGKTVRVFNAAGAEIAANDGNGFINLRSGIYVVSVDGVNAKVRVR